MEPEFRRAARFALIGPDNPYGAVAISYIPYQLVGVPGTLACTQVGPTFWELVSRSPDDSFPAILLAYYASLIQSLRNAGVYLPLRLNEAVAKALHVAQSQPDMAAYLLEAERAQSDYVTVPTVPERVWATGKLEPHERPTPYGVWYHQLRRVTPWYNADFDPEWLDLAIVRPGWTRADLGHIARTTSIGTLGLMTLDDLLGMLTAPAAVTVPVPR